MKIQRFYHFSISRKSETTPITRQHVKTLQPASNECLYRARSNQELKYADDLIVSTAAPVLLADYVTTGNWLKNSIRSFEMSAIF